MELTLMVCDVCQDPRRPVERYSVANGDRQGHTDRCTEHSTAFEQVLGGQPARRSKKAAPRTRAMRPSRRAERIKTMEEIEALKIPPRPAPTRGINRVTTMEEIEAQKAARKAAQPQPPSTP